MDDLLDAAATFLQTHARQLERRRFTLLFAGEDAAGALAALAGYANADGGFGWGLEPDLRTPPSQPGAALHAFEVLEEAAAAGQPAPDVAAALCDWLDRVALDGGAVPFSTPGAAGAGTAPWWAGADPAVPSLHITAAACEAAQRLARHDAAVAAHPWVRRATDWTLERIAEVDRPDGGYELMYVLRFLDAIADREPAAAGQLDRLIALVPRDGRLPVHGGAEGEMLELLDLSPRPDAPLRARLDPAAVAAALDGLLAERHDDGGWDVGFPTQTAMSALEWRGYATVGALKVLRAHDRLGAGA